MTIGQKDKRHNDKNGLLTRKEVRKTGIPYYTGYRWHGLPTFSFLIGITHLRCSELGIGVLNNEQPIAYIYMRAGTGYTGYVPIFDRTDFGLRHMGLIKESEKFTL